MPLSLANLANLQPRTKPTPNPSKIQRSVHGESLIEVQRGGAEVLPAWSRVGSPELGEDIHTGGAIDPSCPRPGRPANLHLS